MTDRQKASRNCGLGIRLCNIKGQFQCVSCVDILLSASSEGDCVEYLHLTRSTWPPQRWRLLDVY